MIQEVSKSQLSAIFGRFFSPVRWFLNMFLPDAQKVLHRIDSYWRWISLLIFLLIPLDMLMTLLGAATVGISGEVNPIMQWGLRQGIAMLVIINILAATVVIAFFHFMLWLLPWMSEDTRPYFALMLETQIGLGVSFGLWVFVTNLSVYLFQDNVLLEVFLQIF